MITALPLISSRAPGKSLNETAKERIHWLRAAHEGAILAGPPFAERSLAFPSRFIVSERSSLSSQGLAAPNNARL
jgi:hypothetical protein